MRKNLESGYLWVVVFILGALFQWWRGAFLDFFIYGAIATLITLAIQRRMESPQLKGLRFSYAAGWLALSTCVLMFAPIHSVESTVTSLLLLPLVMWIILGLSDAANSTSDKVERLSSRIWILLALVACLSELGNYFGSDFTGSDSKYPTLTVLIDPVVASTAGRIGFIFLWSLVGIELLRGSTQK